MINEKFKLVLKNKELQRSILLSCLAFFSCFILIFVLYGSLYGLWIAFLFMPVWFIITLGNLKAPMDLNQYMTQHGWFLIILLLIYFLILVWLALNIPKNKELTYASYLTRFVSYWLLINLPIFIYYILISGVKVN